MGIKPKFKIEDVAKAFDIILDYIDTATLDALQRVGEDAVRHAKLIKPPDQGGQGFKDWSGNLRSSIGFAIYYDGHQIESSYEGTPAGMQAGQKLADKVGSQTSGYALVVTAGMHYAVYVEKNGRDVLTSAESNAEKWLQEQLEIIKRKTFEMWKMI